MDNKIEEAIAVYTRNRTAENLARLGHVLIAGTFVVPVGLEVEELTPGRFDVPVTCIRQADGTGALPAFTSIEQLLSWKPAGSKYVELRGRQLIEMARGISGIAEVSVNPNGVPRGAIPRSEFDRLLSL